MRVQSLHLENQRSGSEHIRILGPYQNRTKWRIVLVDGKERKSVCVPSRDEALALLAKLQQEVERTRTRTIADSLQDYRAYLVSMRHVLPGTAEHVFTSLASWLPLSMLVSSLTPAKARHLYEELTQTPRPRTGRVLAVATHQYFLSCAKGFGKWACQERLCHVNPFAEVAALGKKRHGKTQLRIDEAKRLADLLQELADAGDADALAILLMLHLGLRQGEVGARIARDVDAQGSLLWITSGKTENAERRLKVPECLRGPLRALALSCVYSLAWSLSLARRLRLIERTSRLDPLTGLGSGDWLQAERWPAALRSGQPLGVLYVDLDHLKWTNDTKGHGAGDQYIRTAAEVLRQSVRRGVDEVFRSHRAGDEFEVLLLGLLADPRARAEALLQRLSQRGVSASVGLAYTTELQFVPARAELRQRAEAACRQAKARGGGCVVLADPGRTMSPDAPDSEPIDPWRAPTPETHFVQPDSRRTLPSQCVHP